MLHHDWTIFIATFIICVIKICIFKKIKKWIKQNKIKTNWFANIPDFKNWWEVYQVSTDSWCFFFFKFTLSLALVLFELYNFYLISLKKKNGKKMEKLKKKVELINWICFIVWWVLMNSNKINCVFEWPVRHLTHRWQR